MRDSHESAGGTRGHPYGPRPTLYGQDLAPVEAEQHLRDIAAILPGAFYRFRYTPARGYHLDFMTEGVGALTELARTFDLSDFSQWIEHIPESRRQRFVASIDHSATTMTPWIQEFPVETPSGRIWLQAMSVPRASGDGSIVWNGLMIDISAGKQAAAELDRAHSDYRSIFENTTEGIFRTSREGRLLDANMPLVRMHGCAGKAELIERVNDLATDWYVRPADRDRILAELDRYGYVEGFQAEIRRIGTGEHMLVEENSRAIHDDNGDLLYYQGTVRDVTSEDRRRRLAQARSKLLEQVARDVPLGRVLHRVVEGIDDYRPDVTAAILSLTEAGLIEVEAGPGMPKRCLDMLQGASPRQFGGAMAAATEADGIHLHSGIQEPATTSQHFHAAVCEAGFSDAAVIAVREPEGRVLGYLVALVTKVSRVDHDLRGLLHEMAQIVAIALERDLLVQRLVHQAHHDGLTGLPNRALLADRMRQAMLDADRNESTVGILLLDLDGFKSVNDNLGHSAGDELLQEIADRLWASVRGTDTVARIGGDEFVIVLSLDEPSRADELAQRIIAALSEPTRIDQRNVPIRASIGISRYPEDARTVDRLIQAADLAMYAAKQCEQSQYCFFDAGMRRA